MEVARAGLTADPPVEPPRALRPMLRFRRLSGSALGAVRRALDDDAAFRARVSEAVDDRVDEAARLFLTRPAGWAEALHRLEADATAEAEAVAEEAEERSARKRLVLVEEAARRAEGLVERLRSEVAAVRAELGEERRNRRQAEERGAAASARIHGLERERDAAHRRSAALEVEANRLRRGLVEAAETSPPPPPPPPSSVPAVPAVPAPPMPETSVTEPGGAPASEARLRVDELRAAIADASAAAVALGRSLAAAGHALGDDAAPEARPSDRTKRDAAPAPSRRPDGRLPVALPPGLFDDDPAAAEHLVRVRGCVLVVDGYNASLRRWPELPIAEQRRRLVDALAGLAARCGADVHIVFDGDDDTGHARALARRGVHVRFSAREVEADEVILEQVDRLPQARPVVVATDDRRVRREAAARGANVIAQAQLFALL